jgi:hypothetical protein
MKKDAISIDRPVCILRKSEQVLANMESEKCNFY